MQKISQEDIFEKMSGNCTPCKSTPPQSPTRSVKSSTWSATVKRPVVSCSRKSRPNGLRKWSVPANEEENLLAQYGINTPAKRPITYHVNQVYKEDKAIQAVCSGEQWQWRCLGYVAGLLALMFLTSLTTVVCYIYWRDLSQSEHLAQNEIAVIHRAPDMREVADYVLRLAEEVSTMHGSSQDKNRTVLLKPPGGGILEELFGEEPDLACAGHLGSVLATPDTTAYTVPARVSIYGLLSFTNHVACRPAHTTIKGLIQEVGDCWAFSGERGRLVLALHRPSAVSSVSLSHIRSSADITSAPRHFQVLAHRAEEDLENGLFLGQFEYSRGGPWRQTFTIHQQVVNDQQFRIIEFKFVSNHGNPNYTCVYRVHVHGTVSD